MICSKVTEKLEDHSAVKLVCEREIDKWKNLLLLPGETSVWSAVPENPFELAVLCLDLTGDLVKSAKVKIKASPK